MTSSKEGQGTDRLSGENMINLTSPAAPAALGNPKSNNMAGGVIDALKRLERVGSENSKTTQKLITAAAKLAQTIVAQYYPEAHIPSLAISKFDGYSIANSTLCRNNEDVAGSRYNALAFSKDVATGLLDCIAEELEERTHESAAALSMIEVHVPNLGVGDQRNGKPG